jgi:hypothetical protein
MSYYYYIIYTIADRWTVKRQDEVYSADKLTTYTTTTMSLHNNKADAQSMLHWYCHGQFHNEPRPKGISLDERNDNP